jgi:hypothetical protein
MPAIMLLGVPKHQQTIKFTTALQQRVYGMEVLHLTKNDVSPFFMPADGPMGEIMIFIAFFFDLPERTPEVRQILAERLRDCTKMFCPDATLIECGYLPFDQTLGFARFAKPIE